MAKKRSAQIIPFPQPTHQATSSLDVILGNIDLYDFLAPHGGQMHIVPVGGNYNRELDIGPGDSLVVDCAQRARAGELAVFERNGELVVKRCDRGMESESWGAVLHMIRTLRTIEKPRPEEKVELLPQKERTASPQSTRKRKSLPRTPVVKKPRGFVGNIGSDMLDGAGIFDGDKVVILDTDDLETGDLVAVRVNETDRMYIGFLRFSGTDELILEFAHPDFEPKEFEAHEITILGRAIEVKRNGEVVQAKRGVRPAEEGSAG